MTEKICTSKNKAFHFCGLIFYYLGSILSTKNSHNSDKIIRFLKISTDFKVVFLPKYSKENFLKSVPQLHQKILSRNFSDFLKFGGLNNFQILFRKFHKTQIVLDRTKPWSFSLPMYFVEETYCKDIFTTNVYSYF